MSEPRRTFNALHVLATSSLSALVIVFSAATLIACAFFTTPTLFKTLRDNPTPFTPNEYVLAAFVAFMYIIPGFLYSSYDGTIRDQSRPDQMTVGAGWAILFSTFGTAVWTILWINGDFKAAMVIQFLVLFFLLYANAVLLRRKPFGPLLLLEEKIVHLPTRFFLVLSLNVLVGLSVYAVISSHGPRPMPPPNPSPTTSIISLSTTFPPSTTFSETITITFSESTTEQLPSVTTTIESQTVEPIPTTTADDSTTTEEDTPSTTEEGGPSTTLEPTATTTEADTPTTTSFEGPTATAEPTTTEEDVPTTTDSPTVTVGPDPSTTEEDSPTTTAEETKTEVTVTHTSAPTPLPPTPENPNPQQSLEITPGQQDIPEPIKAAMRQPAIVFLVLVNILELIVLFWREDSSLCLAATWIAIGLWTAGPVNSAAKEVSIIGKVFTVLHPLAFGLSALMVRRQKKKGVVTGLAPAIALPGPEGQLHVTTPPA